MSGTISGLDMAEARLRLPGFIDWPVAADLFQTIELAALTALAEKREQEDD